jgi:cell division protease FtsH
MIDAAYQRTLGLLNTKKAEVEKLAKELLDKEVLHKSDVEALIGNRPFEEEKVVTFDVEEGKDKITTEETPVADVASTEQVIAATPEQASVASTEQAIVSDDTEKPSAA